MPYEILELDQAVDGVQEDEAVGSPYFAFCMEFLGRTLASRVVSALPKTTVTSVRVVCSVEDYELLAVPFAAAMNEQEIDTAISCLWSILEEATEFVPAKSVLVSQAHRDGPTNVDLLVLICSSFSEPAVVADHLSRAANATQAGHYLAISPFDALRAEQMLNQELEVRGAIPPGFVDLSNEIIVDPKFDLLQRSRQHLTQVYGRIGAALLPADFGGRDPRYDNDYEPPQNII